MHLDNCTYLRESTQKRVVPGAIAQFVTENQRLQALYCRLEREDNLADSGPILYSACMLQLFEL